MLLVEPVLAEEVQMGSVISEDDNKLATERASRLSAKGEGNPVSGNA